MHPARGLKAWEAADKLANEVREAVERFPFKRSYGLAGQLCRAADSVAANIAEGSGRKTKSDQVHFYRIGLASAQETMNSLKRARGAKLMDDRVYYRLANRAFVTHALLSALIRKLES
jgi:four helix bundle protein